MHSHGQEEQNPRSGRWPRFAEIYGAVSTDRLFSTCANRVKTPTKLARMTRLL
ncbi:unnamed protein product [Prunus brigantina]